MKTLIKLIIILFFTALMVSYIFIPTLYFIEGTKELWPIKIPWYVAMYTISHTFVGVAIMIVPVIYIYKWIDESKD